MVGGKALGLVQRLARDRGDIGPASAPHDIPGEFIQPVGGRPFQQRVDLFLRGAGGIDRQIAHLVVGQNDLGPQPGRVERDRRLAQDRQFAGKIGRIERDLAHQSPAGARAMQQANTLEG